MREEGGGGMGEGGGGRGEGGSEEGGGRGRREGAHLHALTELSVFLPKVRYVQEHSSVTLYQPTTAKAVMSFQNP